MTEIPDLITDQRERLVYLSKDFFNRLQDKHKEEERALDRMYEEHRRWIHRLHLKKETAYKTVLDRLLTKINHDDDIEILEWLELAMRTRRKDLVADVLERTKPALREAEKSGRGLEIDIRAEGQSMSGCLYRDRKRGYFSFLEEFLDGYDDDVAFTVMQGRMSERERKAAREAESDATVRKWILERREADLEKVRLDLREHASTLREVAVEEVAEGLLGGAAAGGEA